MSREGPESGLYHPTTEPEFEFEKGQAFKLQGDEDPVEYWYVLARVWNYDADDQDYYPPDWYHCQYLIGEVSSLGGNSRLTCEADIREHYEPVDTETAQEVI